MPRLPIRLTVALTVACRGISHGRSSHSVRETGHTRAPVVLGAGLESCSARGSNCARLGARVMLGAGLELCSARVSDPAETGDRRSPCRHFCKRSMQVVIRGETLRSGRVRGQRPAHNRDQDPRTTGIRDPRTTRSHPNQQQSTHNESTPHTPTTPHTNHPTHQPPHTPTTRRRSIVQTANLATAAPSLPHVTRYPVVCQTRRPGKCRRTLH